MSSVLPSPWSNAPLVTGISNPMASLRRSSFFVHHWWRDSGMDLSSLTHSSAEDFYRFWICLINSFHCSGQWLWMFLLLFTNVELSFSRCCSWLKGEPPGTRTLAAGSQKKERKCYVWKLFHWGCIRNFWKMLYFFALLRPRMIWGFMFLLFGVEMVFCSLCLVVGSSFFFLFCISTKNMWGQPDFFWRFWKFQTNSNTKRSDNANILQSF